MYEHPKQWDLDLGQAEFAYNDSPNISTYMSPFQFVYGMHPRGVYEVRYLGKHERRSVEGEDLCMGCRRISRRDYMKVQKNINKEKT